MLKQRDVWLESLPSNLYDFIDLVKHSESFSIIRLVEILSNKEIHYTYYISKTGITTKQEVILFDDMPF